MRGRTLNVADAHKQNAGMVIERGPFGDAMMNPLCSSCIYMYSPDVERLLGRTGFLPSTRLSSLVTFIPIEFLARSGLCLRQSFHFDHTVQYSDVGFVISPPEYPLHVPGSQPGRTPKEACKYPGKLLAYPRLRPSAFPFLVQAFAIRTKWFEART